MYIYLRLIFGSQETLASNSLLIVYEDTRTVFIHLLESPCIIRHEIGMNSNVVSSSQRTSFTWAISKNSNQATKIFKIKIASRLSCKYLTKMKSEGIPVNENSSVSVYVFRVKEFQLLPAYLLFHR